MKPSPRAVLGLVFLTVFLDIVGFGILFPLFPRMLDHYLELEGPDSLFGRFIATLRGWTDGSPFAVVVLFGGVLGSLYSALQFLFAPLWGALSDRIGRRPTLLLTLAGTALAHLGWVFAESFALLIAVRVLGGVMAGNISTASAAAADVTGAGERAKAMGIVGMAIGLGFVLGPALGALAGSWDPTATFDGVADWGVHPFSGAALASFVLAVVNLLGVARRFPETLSAENRGRSDGRTLSPFAALRRLDLPGVARANLSYLLYLTAFSAMEFTLTFLAVERFDYSYGQNAAMFVFVGLTIAFVQGGVVRRHAARIGEKRLCVVGAATTVPGLWIVGAAASSVVLYAGLFLMAVGSALVTPCLSALLSRYTPADRQGLSLGIFRSMGALSRALGPVIGGVLYWQFGSNAPYLCGGAFLLWPLFLMGRLPAPEEPPQEKPEG